MWSSCNVHNRLLEPNQNTCQNYSTLKKKTYFSQRSPIDHVGATRSSIDTLEGMFESAIRSIVFKRPLHLEDMKDIPFHCGHSANNTSASKIKKIHRIHIPSADHFFAFSNSKIGAVQGRRRAWRPDRSQNHWNSTEVRCSLNSPGTSFSNCMCVKPMATYSGSVIFCRFEKKSDLMMVDCDKMLPDRLRTTFVTSSGSATPTLVSPPSNGFRACNPSLSSSFSNVLMTIQHH